MKQAWTSFGYAAAGTVHAFRLERNLRLFAGGYVLILVLGGIVGLLPWEWAALVFAGGLFFSVELLNTALERLSDVLDHERKLLGREAYHEGMKWTKDVSAAASLFSLVTTITITITVFWPYADIYLF